MAGIEPASERLNPRTSTSVVICFLSLKGLQTTKGSFSHLLEPESPSYASLAASGRSTPAFVAPVTPPAGERW